MIENVTVVIIGKNEALHLRRTFASVCKVAKNIIFVDSDSIDNSIDIAKEFNIPVILKVKASYGTAALSRSIGATFAKTEYIQFLDGDETIEESWLPKAIPFLEKNHEIGGVHGFKKVFKENDKDFYILSDGKDWEPDYLQGAFLIKRAVYEASGGMETRIFGEEERDLYLRVKSKGFKLMHKNELMASHYDFKKKGIKNLMLGESSYTIWLPLLKAIKSGNLKHYVFVYRYLLPCLTIELLSLMFLAIDMTLISLVLFLQLLELIFCITVKRRGYFFVWKAAILNIPRAHLPFSRKYTHNVSVITNKGF
jgi:glycosyltransferase involved in cell wall biosynthesis